MKKLLTLFSISAISLSASSNAINCQQHYNRDLDGFKLEKTITWTAPFDKNNGKYQNVIYYIAKQIFLYTNIDYNNTILLDPYLIISVTSPNGNTFSKGDKDDLGTNAEAGKYNVTISLDQNDKVFILKKPVETWFNLKIINK